LTTSDYIDFNDPMFTNVMWGIGRSATIAGFKGKLLAAGLSEPQIEALASALSTVTSATVSGVNNMLRTVNPDNGLLEPSTLDDIADIDRLKPTITQTFELGYNGMLGNRLKFNVDVYRTQKNDFIGPLTVETPNVFLDPATLSAFLGNEFDTALFYNPAEAAALGTVIADSNSNGLTDELTALFAENAAGIPFGTVTPQEAVDPTAVLVTYRNFGDISFYGTDLAFAYHLNQNWNFGGSYSYISKNFFEKSGDQVHDIHLNSPKHKFGVQLHYTNPGIGFNAQTRFRFIDAFEMDSPFYGSQINAYKVVDVNMGLNFFYNTHLALTIQNLFDNKHVEFIGGPEIGRLAIMRLTQTF
ncbi:MAG: TonB-dependent receptor, partial [FCB group bacterium]|nr:TonB-dependent receptor [FCB group bacterium]